MAVSRKSPESLSGRPARRLMDSQDMRHPLAVLVASLVLVSAPAVARAEPWFGWGENAQEDAFADGDLDEEDHVALHLGAHTGSADLHGESWLSLMGFSRELQSGKNDVGGLVVVGLALDRVASGDVHRLGEPAPLPPAPASHAGRPLAALASARECVAAAWRASGLGEDDARLDSIAARSRSSALLPETRMRAMRLWTDAAHATTLATTDGTTYYDAAGANLVLELRLTWRLDRLLFAGDEPTLERVRLERQDARARVATRTLETLFAWQRATLDTRQTAPGSREESEALLRVAETEATLDVLTGGWFSQVGARRAASP